MAGSGQVVSYAQLEANSNRVAQLLRSLGLGHGDTIAMCMENRAEFFDLAWGAQRAGLVFVAISNRLTASESITSCRQRFAGVVYLQLSRRHA
jgi:long-chain acyl-CoA synthetase